MKLDIQSIAKQRYYIKSGILCKKYITFYIIGNVNVMVEILEIYLYVEYVLVRTHNSIELYTKWFYIKD